MGAPQNVITYGNVTLAFPKLTVEAQAVYGDDDFTQIGTRYRFSVTGIIGGISQSDLATKVCLMKQALNVPKQQFTVAWSGDSDTTLYSYGPNDDIDYGPKPGALTIWAYSGGRAAAYNWSLDVYAKDCYGTGDGMSCAATGRQSQILAFTREYSFSVDNNGFTRRTVSGRITLTAQGGGAHSYAGLIGSIVRQPQGYQRVQQDYHQSANGRHLDYSIVDQELMWTFPIPITGGEANFSVRIDPFGARQEFLLTGRYSAPATVGKDQLVNQALLLAATKIPSVAGVTVIPTEIEIAEDVYRNEISFRFGAWSATGASVSGSGFANGPLATFGGRPPDTNNQQVIGTYGGTGGSGSDSGLVAPGVSIVDGCSQFSPGDFPTDASPGQSNPGGGLVTYGDNNPNPNGQSAQNISNPGNISPDHADSMWLEYREMIQFHVKNRIATCIPKVAGAAPIFRQTGIPTLTITQQGYAVRLINASNPADFNAPDPIFDSSSVQFLDSEFTTSSGEPVGNSNWNKYKLSWCYVMRWSGPLQSINGGDGGAIVSFGDDPRRLYQGPTLSDLPEIVVAQSQ